VGVLNFTTFTAAGADAGTLLSTTSARATLAACDGTNDAQLWLDQGAAYYNGDFEFTLDAVLTTEWTSTSTQSALIWSVTNTTNDPNDYDSCIEVWLQTSLNGNRLLLLECYPGGSITASDVTAYTVVKDDVQYIRVTRDESVGTNGTVYVDVYSTSANRDSETSATYNLSIALSAKVDFRYIWGPSVVGTGATAPSSIACYVENLTEILAAPTTVIASPITMATAIPASSWYSPPVTITPDPIIINSLIPASVAGTETVAFAAPLIFDVAIPASFANIPSVIEAQPISMLFVVRDVDVMGKPPAIGVTGFTSNSTVEVAIYDMTAGARTVLLDWTSTGVVESPNTDGLTSTYYRLSAEVGDDRQVEVKIRNADVAAEHVEFMISLYEAYILNIRGKVNLLPIAEYELRRLIKLMGWQKGNPITQTETQRYDDQGTEMILYDNSNPGVTRVEATEP